MNTRRPNFFIVGAPKCGTTAWVEYLRSHPDVYFCPEKEPHYFCADFPNFRWAQSQSDYLQLFAGAAGQRIVAEASVQYLYSRVAAERIRDFNPEARILIFVRDQRTFLPSYHNQLLYNLDEDISDFTEAWRLAIDGKRYAVPSTCRAAQFLDYPAVGRFDEQVQRYINLFHSDQLMVVRYEDWTQQPRSAYLRVLSFLGVADDGRATFEPVHMARAHRLSLLARLTQRPPEWLLAIAAVARRLSGRRRLGLASKLRTANQMAGYSGLVTESIQLELEQYYKESNLRLDKLIDHLGRQRG